MFKLLIKKPNLDPYSNRQYNADVFCKCCGRGIPDRRTAYVVVQTAKDAEGLSCFLPIPWEEVKGRDSVEWGSFVGSHCAKQLPKEYKITQKKVSKAWEKNGCP